MNVAARTLLPFLFGLTSLAAVACGPVVAPGEEGADEQAEETTAAEAPEMLSGSIGAAADLPFPGAAPAAVEGAMSTPITELVVSGPTPAVFEVLSYRFGVENTVNVGAVSGGAGAGKASLMPLEVTVRPAKPGTAPLMKQLALGMPIETMTLRQRSAGGAKGELTTEIAEFGTAMVTSMSAALEGGATDSYAIAVGKVTVKAGGVATGHDWLENTPSGDPGCGPDTAPALGPYVQADPSWKLPKGAVRIDSASIEVTNEVSLGSQAGGGGAGKARLDHIAVVGPMERSGVCAFYYAARGLAPAAVRIDAASAVDAKSGALVVEQSWEACKVGVESVTFEGHAGDAAPRQSITMRSAALVRTDWTHGKLGGKASVYGWSFAENKAVSSCQ